MNKEPVNRDPVVEDDDAMNDSVLLLQSPLESVTSPLLVTAADPHSANIIISVVYVNIGFKCSSRTTL